MAAITATIVAYGGADEIIAAVNSILAHAPEDFLLYLVDNHSPDDTAARLAEQNWDGRVKLICLEKNLGFGGGHNAVLPLLDSRYHFVLNPDILVDSPVLSQLASMAGFSTCPGENPISWVCWPVSSPMRGLWPGLTGGTPCRTGT